jgi:hypothetical protein
MDNIPPFEKLRSYTYSKIHFRNKHMLIWDPSLVSSYLMYSHTHISYCRQSNLYPTQRSYSSLCVRRTWLPMLAD